MKFFTRNFFSELVKSFLAEKLILLTFVDAALLTHH